MDNNDFVKMWSKSSDALYDTEKTIEVLEALNKAISGLYFLGGEERFISQVLNTSTYVDEEYARLIKRIGMDLCDVANVLELARSILFGDSFDWNSVLKELEKAPKKEMKTNNLQT